MSVWLPDDGAYSPKHVGMDWYYVYVFVLASCLFYKKMNYSFNCYVMNQQMHVYKHVQSQLSNCHGPGKTLYNNISCLVTLLVYCK